MSSSSGLKRNLSDPGSTTTKRARLLRHSSSTTENVDCVTKLEMPLAPPYGPRNLQEATLQWAEQAVGSVPVEAFGRLEHLFSSGDGIAISSHCSGMGSMEQIMAELAKAVRTIGGGEQRQGKIFFTHASDAEPIRQLLLLNLNEGPDHVHGKMEERLPDDLKSRFGDIMDEFKKMRSRG